MKTKKHRKKRAGVWKKVWMEIKWDFALRALTPPCWGVFFTSWEIGGWSAISFCKTTDEGNHDQQIQGSWRWSAPRFFHPNDRTWIEEIPANPAPYQMLPWSHTNSSIGKKCTTWESEILLRLGCTYRVKKNYEKLRLGESTLTLIQPTYHRSFKKCYQAL